MDIRYQKISNVEVRDEKVYIGLKDRTLPYLLGLEDKYDTINYESMLKIYDELSKEGKPVSIGVGAVGSSDSQYSIFDGGLYICKYHPYGHENWGLSSYEIIKKAIQSNNIIKISLCGSDTMGLDRISGELPDNTSISELHGFCYMNKPNISSFKGLYTLEISIRDSGNTEYEYLDMDFLMDLPKLETLIIHKYSDLIDFTNVECYSVKKVIIYEYDESAEDFENILHTAFPAAEIEIIYDYKG